MKLDPLEKSPFPSGWLTQNSLSGLAARVNEVLTGTLVDSTEDEKTSYWQLVFLQSKVNGCSYRGEALPHAKWQWPRNTWFQGKMTRRLKALELAGHLAARN